MFFFCFQDAQPTEAERETWKQVDVVLMDARAILDELQAYNGAGKEIREVYRGTTLLIYSLSHLLIILLNLLINQISLLNLFLKNLMFLQLDEIEKFNFFGLVVYEQIILVYLCHILANSCRRKTCQNMPSNNLCFFFFLTDLAF